MQKAVVLLSGGIGSTVAAATAREQFEPCLLHVNWGHRSADRELASFEHIVAALKIEQTRVVDLSCMATFGGNARVSRRLGIEDTSAIRQETPATFALGLMPTMLSLAASWAAAINARRIIVGISEDHGVSHTPISTLYPDRKREFIQTFNLMLQYAKPHERELLVEAPLLELTRAEVVKLGDLMKIPYEKTWSCYASNDEPCGRCLACTTRTTAFLQANLPDPLMFVASHT